MSKIDLQELSGLSQKLEQAVKTELQNALIKGMNEEHTQASLEKSLTGLPEQIAQSLAPVFNLIGAIAGPRITNARKQKLIEQIHAENTQTAKKGK